MEKQEYVVIHFKKEVQPTRYLYLLTPRVIKRDEGSWIESDTEYRQTRPPDDRRFVSVIVCATSEEEATKIRPYDSDWGRCGWATSASDVMATLLGTADPSIPQGLISSAFGDTGHTGTLAAKLGGWVNPYFRVDSAVGNLQLFPDLNPIHNRRQAYLITYKDHDLWWELDGLIPSVIAKYGAEEYQFRRGTELSDPDEHLKEAWRIAEKRGHFVGKPRG